MEAQSDRLYKLFCGCYVLQNLYPSTNFLPYLHFNSIPIQFQFNSNSMYLCTFLHEYIGPTGRILDYYRSNVLFTATWHSLPARLRFRPVPVSPMHVYYCREEEWMTIVCSNKTSQKTTCSRKQDAIPLVGTAESLAMRVFTHQNLPYPERCSGRQPPSRGRGGSYP